MKQPVGRRAPAPSPIPAAIGALSRVFGVLGGVLWPSPIGSGELPPEERARSREAARERDRLQRAPNPLTQTGGPPRPPQPPKEPLTEIELPPRARRSPLPLPEPLMEHSDPTRHTVPEPPAPRSRAPSPTRQRGSGRGTPPARARSLDFDPWRLIRRETRTTRTRQPAARSLPVPTSSIGFVPGIEALPQPIPGPTQTPLTPPPAPRPDARPVPTPTPGLTPFTATSVGCPPCAPPRGTRTRKKRRKCRARANVIWAGGPNKGKPAGSRCISFEKG